MPIDWNDYHPNFKTRGPAYIKRKKYTCEECGRKRGDEYLTKGGKIDTIVIQAHHPNHDRMNPKAKLVALCEPCHLKADGGYHQKIRKRNAKEAELEAGQMILPGFEEKKKRGKKVS
jgi:hypothetical protein